MILRIAQFLSLLVLSMAMNCSDVPATGFTCRGNPIPQLEFDDCREKKQFVVCMHVFSIHDSGLLSFNRSGAAVIESEAENKCYRRTEDEISVYCSDYNCELDVYKASNECRSSKIHRFPSLICGKKVYTKAKKKRETGLSCGVRFIPEGGQNHPHELDKWLKDTSWITDYETPHCEYDGHLRMHCLTDRCDEKSRMDLLRDFYCFDQRVITCSSVDYVVGAEVLIPRYNSDLKAACAIEIRVINGTVSRSSSFIQTPNPSSCGEVNSTSHSFTVFCRHDNCDISLNAEDLAGSCGVELFKCGDKYHFLYQNTEVPYCVFNIAHHGGNMSFLDAELVYPSEEMKSSCHSDGKGKFRWFCDKDCDLKSMEGWNKERIVHKCLDKEEEQIDEDEIRLLISVLMPILTILIGIPVIIGGLCVLAIARRAAAYEEEKYMAEFGVSFGESEPETEVEVPSKMTTTKKSGVNTGKTNGKTTKTTTTGKTTMTVKSGKTTGRTRGRTTGTTTTTVKTVSKPTKHSIPS